MQGFEKRTSGKKIVAHGGEDLIGIAGNGGGVGVLLVEGENAVVRAGFDDAEFVRVFSGHGNGGDGAGGARMLVRVDHVRDVHPIDVIGAEDRDDVGLGLLDEVDVLVDGVGRSLIPGFAGGAHLGGHGNDELVFQNAAVLPAFVQVLEEALAAELSEYVDGIDAGVDEVAEDEIDDAVFAAERDGGLGALLG